MSTAAVVTCPLKIHSLVVLECECMGVEYESLAVAALPGYQSLPPKPPFSSA